MALIQCPECGKQVSDKADKCPECGCPIAGAQHSDLVRIKLGQLGGSMGSQTVTILINGNEVWKGKSGETAEISITEKVDVTVKYGTNLKYLGSSCTGSIDPSYSKRYAIAVTSGMFYKTILRFQTEDMHVA